MPAEVRGILVKAIGDLKAEREEASADQRDPNLRIAHIHALDERIARIEGYLSRV
jgi:hypothetical protein